MTIQSLHFDHGLGHPNIRTVIYGLHILLALQITNKQKKIKKKIKLFHYHKEHTRQSSSSKEVL